MLLLSDGVQNGKMNKPFNEISLAFSFCHNILLF